MDSILTITTGVLSGVAASALFLWFSFSYFKPKVEISPHLAINEISKPPYIEIKFINLTNRAINDVKVELLKSEITNVNGGPFYNHKDIVRKDIYHVAPFDKKDDNARYAFRVTEAIDIRSLWQSDQNEFITVMVHATDSMSGFSKTFRKELRNIKSVLKEGSHEFGTSFDVKPNT